MNRQWEGLGSKHLGQTVESLFIGSASGAISDWKRYGTMKPSTGVSWAEHIHIFYF